MRTLSYTGSLHVLFILTIMPSVSTFMMNHTILIAVSTSRTIPSYSVEGCLLSHSQPVGPTCCLGRVVSPNRWQGSRDETLTKVLFKVCAIRVIDLFPSLLLSLRGFVASIVTCVVVLFQSIQCVITILPIPRWITRCGVLCLQKPQKHEVGQLHNFIAHILSLQLTLQIDCFNTFYYSVFSTSCLIWSPPLGVQLDEIIFGLYQTACIIEWVL